MYCEYCGYIVSTVDVFQNFSLIHNLCASLCSTHLYGITSLTLPLRSSNKNSLRPTFISLLYDGQGNKGA